MPVARRAPQLSSQAQINAVLRYAPQRQALAAAAQEARAEHDAAIAGAQSDARLNQANVTNAAPAVQGIYQRAEGAASAARQQLAAVLAGLGPAAAPFQAAAASEGAQGAEKTAREGAAQQSDLRSQSLAAAAAPAFARTLADQHLGATLSKILSTSQSLGGQEGLATSTEQAREDKEKRAEALTREGHQITATSDAAGHRIAEEGNQITAKHYAEAGNPNKPVLLTPDKQQEGAKTLREIEGKARALRQGKLTAQQVYAELTTSHPESSKNVIKRDESGKQITNSTQYETVKYKAIEPHDALLTQAAIDSVYGYGRVSKKTLEKLHNAGYSLKELQLQGPGPGGKPVAPAAPKPGERSLKAIAGLF